MNRIVYAKKRGCGWPKAGGVYLVSEDGSPDGALARVVQIDPPVPTQRKPHRGPILVDGQKILARAPEDEWVVGASAKTVQKNRADDVWKEMFGLPLEKRLLIGDCHGMSSADEAYQHLLNSVQWNNHAVHCLRQLAIEEIQNLPNVAPIYARIVRHIQDFALTRGTDPNHLVKVAAACWELFYAVPGRKRDKLTAVAHLLAAIGLVKDGRQMLMAINPV